MTLGGSWLRLIRTTLLVSVVVVSGCGGDDSDSAPADVVTDTGATVDSGAADTGTTVDSGAAKDTKPSVKCHPVQNTGCPTGQHCVWEGDTITCVEDGEHGVGEECGDGKGCKVGICVSVQGSDKSVCAPHCLANLECASGLCNKLTDSKGKVCDMNVQVEQCNPLNQKCPNPGDGCYPAANGFICLSSGSKESGQPCPDYNSCAPGLACVGKSGSSGGVCRKICVIGKANQTCDDITAECAPLLGSSTVGFCGS